jgi:uncharacterized membrane protein
MIRAAVAILATLLFGVVMSVHLFYGGEMPRLAIFALGVALVFLGDFSIYFGRAFWRWHRWRRGDFHERETSTI